MNFADAEAEQRFRRQHHLSRLRCDQFWALFGVAATCVLYARLGAEVLALPAVWTMLAGSAVLTSAVAVGTTLWPAAYVRHRCAVLTLTRLFFALATPAMVYETVRQPGRTAPLTRSHWFGVLFAWAIFSRWISQVVTAVGLLLPFDYEVLLLTASTAVDLLNNERVCAAITQHPFQAQAFLLLERYWPSALDWCSHAAGSTAVAAAAVVSGNQAGSRTAAAACYCESLFVATQLLLSVGIPLLFIFLLERAQRASFTGKHPRLRGTEVCYNRCRLLCLLVAIILRLCLALRFETGSTVRPATS